MPNTLGHIGIQAPLSNLFFKKAELQWIVLGCVIPDIPWIIQRVLFKLQLFDPYMINYYTTIQASLLFSVVLGLSFSMLSRGSMRICLLLLFNIVIHLLLDSCEIKWGNGVLLFAPLSWDLTRFDLFWTNHPINLVVSAAGLFFLLFYWRAPIFKDIQLIRPRGTKATIFLLSLGCYFLVPTLFIGQAEQADIKYLATLQDKQARPGKTIKAERLPFSSDKNLVRFFSHEEVRVKGNLPKHASLLSIKGKFITMDTIEVIESHGHSHSRDWASIVGLISIAGLWTGTLYSQFRQIKFPAEHNNSDMT